MGGRLVQALVLALTLGLQLLQGAGDGAGDDEGECAWAGALPAELQVQSTPPLHFATAHSLHFPPQLACGRRCHCFHVRWMIQEGEGAWRAADAAWEAPWVAVRGLRPSALYRVAVWLRPKAHADASAQDWERRWFRALPAHHRTCPERTPQVRRLRVRALPEAEADGSGSGPGAEPGAGAWQVEARWAPPLPDLCRSALLVLARVPPAAWRMEGGVAADGSLFGALHSCPDWPGQHCLRLPAPHNPDLVQVALVRRGDEGGWSGEGAAQAAVESAKQSGDESTSWPIHLQPHPHAAGAGDAGEGPEAVWPLLLLALGLLVLLLCGALPAAAMAFRRRRRAEAAAAAAAGGGGGGGGELISAWTQR
ncbi:hypothetical protein R5R35_002200 [Gryllus longicercus]|uniref:Uncharacterized protein n=1 Tax=Gryllus longicercus TaxID=2509291 RepID=A0AAN9Z224_9ORTH